MVKKKLLIVTSIFEIPIIKAPAPKSFWTQEDLFKKLIKKVIKKK